MNDILYQIHLIDKMQKHSYHFVKSDSKEHALSFFIKQFNIDLNKYSIILVVDLTKQIHIDSENSNIFELKIVDDKLESYSQSKNNLNLIINKLLNKYYNLRNLNES